MMWLDGKKTYIAGFGVVVAAAVAWLTGEMTLADAIVSGLGGLGLAALRAGVAKS